MENNKNIDPQHHGNLSSEKISGVLPFFDRHRLKVIVTFILIVAISGAVLFVKSSALASLNEKQALQTRALMVKTATITALDQYEVQQKYSGNIVAGKESDHGFDAGGLLAEILVDEGDRVQKGDILARLDMRRFEAKEKELEADLAQAIAQDMQTVARLGQAKANFDRYRILLEKEHISEQKFDQVKFDLDALLAQKNSTHFGVIKAKAALKSLETDKALATLTARFDGSIIRRYQDEGAALGAGEPVVRLIEDQKLEIHVGLPEFILADLHPGQAYNFDVQGKEITARLRTILSQLDQSTRTVTAIFDVTKQDGSLRAGGLARLSLKSNIKQKGFWLPSSALAESRRGLWSVYSLKPQKDLPGFAILARQELQLLYTDSDRVFVRGTLSDGDRIVSSGIHRLVPGQLVRTDQGAVHVE